MIRCATVEGTAAEVVVRRDARSGADGWLVSLSGQEHRWRASRPRSAADDVAVAVGYTPLRR